MLSSFNDLFQVYLNKLIGVRVFLRFRWACLSDKRNVPHRKVKLNNKLHLGFYNPKFHFSIRSWTVINSPLCILYSTTVIAKIKEMQRALFFDIQYNVPVDYEKWYTPPLLAQCEQSVNLKLKFMSMTCRFHFSM